MKQINFYGGRCLKQFKGFFGGALITFGAGLLLSCILPSFVLVCILAFVIVAAGIIIIN